MLQSLFIFELTFTEFIGIEMPQAKKVTMEVEKEDIKLDQHHTLAELQAAFTRRYSFLKIDFFEVDKTTGLPKATQMDYNTKLTKLPVQDLHASIDISHDKTVAEVTSDFFTKMGVSAQVSRKSGKIWNVITVTESWTLKTQNTAAEFISSLMKLSHI